MIDNLSKNTATHGGDVVPASIRPEPIEIVDNTVINDATQPDNSDYVNPGMNTTSLVMPRDNGPTTRSKGRLKLDNDTLQVDETINSYPKTKKKPYKQVKYKDDYAPPEFDDKVPKIRHLERLSDCDRQQTDQRSSTVWTSSKPAKTKSLMIGHS